MGILLAAWGVIAGLPNWLKTLIIAVVALGLTYMAGDIHGKRIARAECEQKAIEAQHAADAQDDAAADEVKDQDAQVSTWLTEQKKADDAKIADLQSKLNSSSCRYDKSNADPDDQPRSVRHRPKP